MWAGGELLPQMKHGAWNGDNFADLIPEQFSIEALRNEWRAEKAASA